MIMFLKLLFFATTFYVIFARPDVSDNDTEPPLSPKSVPEYAEQPATDDEYYDQKQQEFMSAIINTPSFSHLTSKKLEEYKDMGSNCLASCINYLILLAQASAYNGSLSSNDMNGWANNDIEIEFQAREQWTAATPYIPAISAQR